MSNKSDVLSKLTGSGQSLYKTEYYKDGRRHSETTSANNAGEARESIKDRNPGASMWNTTKIS